MMNKTWILMGLVLIVVAACSLEPTPRPTFPKPVLTRAETSPAPPSAPVFQNEGPAALPATPKIDSAAVPTVAPDLPIPLTPKTASRPKPPVTPVLSKAPIPTSAPTEESQDMTASDGHADLQLVTVSGSPGSYSFSVTVRSPDTGCDRYADWWEVLSSEGQLIYRRVLFHSHAGEQPFTRSGGPVDIRPEETIIVRAHMNDSGYGGVAMRGSVMTGFTPTELPPAFAGDVEEQQPNPQGCAF